MSGAALANGLAEAFAPGRLSAALHHGLDAPHHGPTAAVAAVLRPIASHSGAVEMLFIERATKSGDPWSGHMAFPGGRTEAHDDDTFDTAVRETREEIGFDIAAHAGVRWLGRLSEVEGSPRWSNSGLRVTPHVCWLAGDRPELRLNYEVADALWVPVVELADPARHVEYRYPVRPDMTFPGIEVTEYGSSGSGGSPSSQKVVWGLTLRMLGDLFTRVGHPLPLDLGPAR